MLRIVTSLTPGIHGQIYSTNRHYIQPTCIHVDSQDVHTILMFFPYNGQEIELDLQPLLN